MTYATHIPVRGARRRTALVLLVVLAALAVHTLAEAPAADAASYGWPVKPFSKQHPVRGFFGDPRIAHGPHGETHSIHFGVDVSAPDGTPVYATITGRIAIDARHAETVHVQSDNGTTVFSYWHIVPAVRDGDRATAYRTVLGRIARGWEHVHFAEIRAGLHLNPLRRGAMRPYRDRTRPEVRNFGFERNGFGIGRQVSGRLDLVAEAYDRTPVRVPGRWTGKPVTPAFICWRIVGRGRVITRWQTAADFRSVLPTSFDAIYARWTRQNKRSRLGRYRFLLAGRWDSRTVRDGAYRLEVHVADTRGNASRSSVRFTVHNAPAAG
jgi:hypothetical protein